MNPHATETDRSGHAEPTPSEAMRSADTANGERPEGEGRARMARVLIAVDESEASLRAAQAAHSVFGEHVQYFVVNVGSTDWRLWGGDPMIWGVPYPLVLANLTAQAAPFHPEHALQPDAPTVVDRAEAEARFVAGAAELPADSVALGAAGDPVEQIRQVAHDESIDVIVVGSGSTGWWRHLFEPSVAKAIVRQADRPVMVVP